MYVFYFNCIEYPTFNVFVVLRIEYNKLAAITKPLNLGQGFPDYEPPSRFSNFLAEVASEKNVYFHQYTRGLVIEK